MHSSRTLTCDPESDQLRSTPGVLLYLACYPSVLWIIVIIYSLLCQNLLMSLEATVRSGINGIMIAWCLKLTVTSGQLMLFSVLLSCIQYHADLMLHHA